ncbi:MAG: insulinase family protein [Alphaproteobacteria bacterium]|nr:insulinase family protein [Alphaproteobacteria bacterium]
MSPRAWPLHLALAASLVASTARAADVAAAAAAAPALPAVDRSAPPPVTPASPMDVPALDVDPVRPGVRILWVPVPGVRRVAVTAYLGSGQLALDGGSTAANELLGDQWSVATRGHAADALEQAETDLDASLWAGLDLRHAWVALSVPRDDLGAGLDLFEEVLREPTFPGRELKRSKTDLTMWLGSAAPHSPSTVAAYAERYGWYAPDEPRGTDRVDLGKVASVKRADLVRRHATLLATSPIDLLVVGDVDRAALRPRLVALVDGLGADAAWAPAVPAHPARGERYIGIDLPGIDQANLVVRCAAPPWNAPDAAAFRAVQYAIGGTFLSRLNANLREDKGYTYGGYSRWYPNDTDGVWSFRVQVDQAVVGDALREVFTEMDAMMATGLRDDELAAFRVSEVTDWNLLLGTTDDADSAYSTLVERRSSVAAARADLAAGQAVTIADTLDAARTWLGGPERLVVVVGDRSVIAPQLDGVVPDVTWYTPEQAVFGRLDPVEPTP